MRGFDDEERAEIRDELVETGRELLRLYGPQKTNVEDITEPVGIAKSTFYQFFDSKAELYGEIIERESEDFLEMVEERMDDVNDPQERLERLLRCYAEFSETNPLIQHRQVFLNNLTSDIVEDIGQRQMTAFIPIIESIQEDTGSPLDEYDPVTVLGVMGTIGYLSIHRGEYDDFYEGYYEEVLELSITAVARGLTTDPDT